MTAKDILINEMKNYKNMYDLTMKKANQCIYPPLYESYCDEAAEYQDKADFIRELITKIEKETEK